MGNTITLELWPQLYRYLEAAHETGLFGATIEDTARELLRIELARHLEEKSGLRGAILSALERVESGQFEAKLLEIRPGDPPKKFTNVTLRAGDQLRIEDGGDHYTIYQRTRDRKNGDKPLESTSIDVESADESRAKAGDEATAIDDEGPSGPAAVVEPVSRPAAGRTAEDGEGVPVAPSPSTKPRKPARRFDRHGEIEPEQIRGLAPDHHAAHFGETLFPATVVDVAASPRVLVSGKNQRKLGDRVTKGPWKGMPIYSLTLEERATCPRTCHHWLTCYGNMMHWSRRHRHGPELEAALDVELKASQEHFPDGFVVRLHVLGDFYSVDYALNWVTWMHRYPALHVFGYTAHQPGEPIGQVIAEINRSYPDRFVIRTSSAEALPGGATTIYRRARGRVPEGIVCPAQTEDDTCCGSCGLCWAPAARDDTIVFMAHGRVGGAKGSAGAPKKGEKSAIDQLGDKVYAFLEQRLAAGDMPTNKQIMEGCELRNLEQVLRVLKRLDDAGRIRRTGATKKRRIELLGEKAPPVEKPVHEDENTSEINNSLVDENPVPEPEPAEEPPPKPKKTEPDTLKPVSYRTGTGTCHEPRCRNKRVQGRLICAHHLALKTAGIREEDYTARAVEEAIAAGRLQKIPEDGKVPEIDALDRLVNWYRDIGRILAVRLNFPPKPFVVDGNIRQSLDDVFSWVKNGDRECPVSKADAKAALRARFRAEREARA